MSSHPLPLQGDRELSLLFSFMESEGTACALFPPASLAPELWPCGWAGRLVLVALPSAVVRYCRSTGLSVSGDSPAPVLRSMLGGRTRCFPLGRGQTPWEQSSTEMGARALSGGVCPGAPPLARTAHRCLHSDAVPRSSRQPAHPRSPSPPGGHSLLVQPGGAALHLGPRAAPSPERGICVSLGSHTAGHLFMCFPNT